MSTEPQLTEREWALIRELLMAARRELPCEIRHTDTARVRHELQERLRLVEDLLQRLEPAAVGV